MLPLLSGEQQLVFVPLFLAHALAHLFQRRLCSTLLSCPSSLFHTNRTTELLWRQCVHVPVHCSWAVSIEHRSIGQTDRPSAQLLPAADGDGDWSADAADAADQSADSEAALAHPAPTSVA